MKTVSGTKDYYGTEAQGLRYLDQLLLSLAKKYNCQEIKTPILEMTQLFTTSLGETTDIVSKEMFTFPDKSGDSLTLRPEGTAGITRAIFSNSLVADLPLKFYYSGPMFRYETPQKGRYRQFTQLGVEFLGYENYQADLECITLAWEFIQKLNLTEKVQLEINSIGDKQSRENYKQALVNYLTQYKNELSPESQDRLNKNPLRILDSKKDQDQVILKNAPQIKDYLSDGSKKWFDQLKKGLNLYNIPFVENSLLVRGLDYYSETVFEITTTEIGSQNAILAGGRYNDLSSQIGGERVPSVGFAAGAERLLLLINEQIQPTSVEFSIITLNNSDPVIELSLKMIKLLRDQNYIVDVPQNESLNKKMKKANKNKSKWAVIIGENEVLENKISLKNMTTGEQTNLEPSQLVAYLSNK